MSRSPYRRFSLFELSPLEARVFLTSTPASPRPETLGSALDKGERQVIVDRFDNNAAQQSALQTKLNASSTQFDNALHNYVQSRTNAKWFFDDEDTADYVAYLLGTTINYTSTVANADAVKEFHKFPEQGSASSYDIDLPNDIDWITPGGSSNPEFLHTLNRHGHFQDLAYAYRVTGDAEYAEELAYEIADWTTQYPTSNVPQAYSADDQDGWRLDTALRAENWANAYFIMIGSAGFSGADSTLMVYKLIQMGDYLQSEAAVATDFGSNRALSVGRSLLLLGQMFPELDTAATWVSTGRTLVFNCARGQLYNDGSHFEQSPVYTSGVAEDLLEARLLDMRNGDDAPWTQDPDGAGPEKKIATIISNAVSSYWQLLSPDGNRPAIGDSYRSTSVTLFLKANLIQGADTWPDAKPRLRDLFLFGPTTINPFLGNPVTPALGARGDTYAMTDGGLYVMRSGNASTDNQIIFDAGPKGGIHGHFDLLSFELFGGGRPLILDPGAFIYEPENPDRQYVVSNKAHNTLNVDSANTGELEGDDNPGIVIQNYAVTGSSAQVTASHFGYGYLRGNPVVTRTVWYDLDGTMLLIDRVEATSIHDYQISFNLAGDASAAATGVQGDNSFRTRYASGGNVKVAPIHVDSGTVARGGLTFVTNTASGDFKDDAYRFTVSKNDSKTAVFVTLVTAYDGTTPPNISASMLTASPTAGGAIQVRLNRNGSNTDLTFAGPTFERLNANAQTDGTYNDVAYDSLGQLHKVWFDRSDRKLKYAARETDGAWSIVQTIADPISAAAGEYQFLSLALDSANRPAVAYFNGWNGDLMFAQHSSVTSAFEVQTLESTGSTGLYPSLAFSRNDGAVITYYNRTKGDLKMASAATGGFTISTLDSAGDVGRFSSLSLDPTRPIVSKFALAYEDTTHGTVKYAVQGNIGPGTKANGYTYYTVEDLQISGGYISMAFFKSGSSDPARAFLPAVSYYDATTTSLRFAYASNPNYGFTAATIANKKQGLYSKLFFSGTNQNSINIYYFDRTNNVAKRYAGSLNWATSTISSSVYTTLAAGGRELHVSRFGSSVVYTNLNEAAGTLRAEFL